MNTKTANIDLNLDVPIPTKDLAALASQAFFEQLVDAEVFRSCINCAHFHEKDKFCNHYQSHPPAQTIVFTCKTSAWEGRIPF
jgi:hypothetical protein